MIRVTAAIIVGDGTVFIARRNPGVRLAGKWEFPGGKIEPGETPEVCLQRELKEEFDIEAKIGQALGSHVYCYDFGTIELTAFRVDEIRGAIRLNDHQAYRWATAKELADLDFAPADLPFVAMIQAGKIRLDGSSQFRVGARRADSRQPGKLDAKPMR